MSQPILLKKLKLNGFNEDLQDLLELTPKKDVLFIIGNWNAKIGSQEIPGVTGKFGIGVQNEAGHTFLPRSKCLLSSWLQSTSAVILDPLKIKSATVSTSICHEVMGPDSMIVGAQYATGDQWRNNFRKNEERLTEFCQENTLVIANTLYQQHKGRLYTLTSSDGQY